MSEQPDINEVNRQVIQEFRANHGQVISGRFAGSKLLLLTTKGAKTGATRVNPMMYVQDANRYVVFASKRGAPTNPDWYHNLVAHPDVKVEIGDESFDIKAVVAAGEERQRLWNDSVRLHPFLANLQAGTKRQLPLIILALPD